VSTAAEIRGFLTVSVADDQLQNNPSWIFPEHTTRPQTVDFVAGAVALAGA
jgi:hypothetical protein